MKEIVPDWPQKLLLANPRGFCAGVVRAVEALRDFHLKNRGEQPEGITYSYHQIIHNTHVVGEFEEAGVEFVNNLTEIPEGSKVMFSAHGVSPEVVRQAKERRLSMVDATCPLVAKPHQEARRFAKDGYEILYVGHEGHDEAVGLTGEAPQSIKLIQTVEDARAIIVNNPTKLALLTQTTLSIDDTEPILNILRGRFPGIIEPPKSDICYATQNRQDGIKAMVREGAEVVVVVGSQNSSNSERLVEVAVGNGATRSFLIDSAEELDPNWFIGAKAVGLTSGASAPEEKFQEVVSWFKKRGSIQIQEVVVADESRIHFAPPK